MSDLVRVELFEVERSTGAGGGHLLLVLPGTAVRPELLVLTVRNGGAQPQETTVFQLLPESFFFHKSSISQYWMSVSVSGILCL